MTDTEIEIILVRAATCVVLSPTVGAMYRADVQALVAEVYRLRSLVPAPAPTPVPVAPAPGG